MYLECTCSDITKIEWDRLMKHRRPLNYDWLKKRIKKELPSLYNELLMDYYNPYSSQCWSTPTHYIFVHSSIEYFIRK